MMGRAKSSTAVSVVSVAGSRKAVAGTIAEAAAIARRAAEDRQSALIPAPISAPPVDDQERHAAQLSEDSEVPAGQPPSPEADPVANPIHMRRSRAGAGQLKDAPSDPDRTAVHLILAGRAYAYGKNIVHPDDSKKPGDSVAIES